jgi:HK97 family phage portal protein
MGSWLGKFFRRPIAQTIISYTPLTFTTVSADLLGVPAIVRAVNLISTDSARLDLTVTRRDGSVVEDSPAVDLLYGNTASFLSGYEMRKWLATSALYFGNGYLLIRRDLRTGDPVALDPVDPSAVSVEIKGSEARYIVNNSVVDDSSLIHVRASTDPRSPWLGVSPIDQCSRVLGTQAILDQCIEELAKSGFVGKLAVEHPGPLTATARDSMRTKWAEQHSGADKLGFPAFFGEGMKASQMAADAASRLMDAKRMGIGEVARAFGVPPQLLYEGEGRSQPEIAQAYVTHCLAPFCAGIDAELSRKLLPPGERMKTDLVPITQGDFRTAGKAYAALIQVGALAPNDARVRLGLPRIAGLDDPAPVISGITPAANLADADEGDPPYE